MWSRALWSREYAQARLFVWTVPFIHFLALGFMRTNKWLFSDESTVARYLYPLTHSGMSDDAVRREVYENGYFEGMGRLWLLLAVCVLALVQLGVERRNGSQEFLFAMPYSRRKIYLHKWTFGAALIVGSSVLNAAIDMLVTAVSPIGRYFSPLYHLQELGYTCLAMTAIYSLALFVGSVTGRTVSQGALTVAAFALPQGLMMLVSVSVSIQGFPRLAGTLGMNNGYRSEAYERWMNNLSLGPYVTLSYDRISWGKAAALLLLLALSLAAGAWAYGRNRTENNGKLMLFRGWELAMKIVFIACLSMALGLFASALFAFDERAGYDIGLLAGLLLGTAASRRLTSLRFRG